MITDKLWQGAALLLAVLLLLATGANLYQYVERQKDAVKLSEQLQANAELKASVHVQDSAVDALKATSEASQKRFDAALYAFQGIDRKMQPVVDYVKAAKGVTCADAMALVNAALAGGVK